MSATLEANGVARVLTVRRSEARNALDTETIDALVSHARTVKQDATARAIVLAASPPTFVAGGDLREFGALKGRAGGRAVARKGRALIAALRATKLPIVAAVDGDAYGGGCELAAACDLRFAHERASFHWVQNKLAVTTGWGATARLVAIVGASTATRWLLGAETVSAREAHQARFVDEVCAEKSALEAALAWTERLAAIDPAVTAAQLSLVRASLDHAVARSSAAELSAFAACWALPSHEAAVARFIERRERRER
ncbi:MAG: enoyl-CoA hydratase/isomerase family protein [Myxococcales bacterium]|nr:enoyl-CoA hydratase/isomerase family protein [Myxococcales bacterium]